MVPGKRFSYRKQSNRIETKNFIRKMMVKLVANHDLILMLKKLGHLGYTGKNITTAIMDDGVDYTHPDLMHNYVC